MIELIAQLISPPIQNSPVRLPGPDAIEQRPSPAQEPILRIEPSEQPDEQTLPGSTSPQSPSFTSPSSKAPIIRGQLPYSLQKLQQILNSCSQGNEISVSLDICAKAITDRLVADGYINSRIEVIGSGSEGYLQATEGRLAEIRVTSNDGHLQRRVKGLLNSLKGSLLNLNTLQEDLVLLKRTPGVGTIKAELSRIDDDPARALLTLAISSGTQPWQGELALRNDGSIGSGEYRATGALVKGDLALKGDTLLLYGETSWTNDPTIGQVIGSISYTLPVTLEINFTGSFGYTHNDSPELDTAAIDVGSDQYQGLGQFEYTFSESLRHRWSALAGISYNRNTFNLKPAEADNLSLSQDTTYLRLGISGSGFNGPAAWTSNIYLLQALSSEFVDARTATAVGGLISANWAFAPNWQLNGRLGGQIAFDNLPTSMYFSLGSDVGLRGLPGQLISGESGWLSTLEMAWSFWRNSRNTLQLVPFIGAGGVNTRFAQGSFNDTVGSAGLLARWLAGSNWTAELGYVHQFSTNDNLGTWNEWILDDGLYARVSYKF